MIYLHLACKLSIVRPTAPEQMKGQAYLHYHLYYPLRPHVTYLKYQMYLVCLPPVSHLWQYLIETCAKVKSSIPGCSWCSVVMQNANSAAILPNFLPSPWVQTGRRNDLSRSRCWVALFWAATTFEQQLELNPSQTHWITNWGFQPLVCSTQ